MNDTQQFSAWTWALEEAEFSAKTYKGKFAIVDNHPYFGVMPLKLVTNEKILEIVSGAETLCSEYFVDEDEGAEEGGLGEGSSPPA